MVKVALCDDDEMVLKELKSILHQLYETGIRISEHNNFFSLLTYIQDEVKGEVDIIFMDIRLGKESGIDAAYQIQKIYPNIQISFMSAYLISADSIFEVEPAYFLKKPFEKGKIKVAMERMLLRAKKKEAETLILKVKKGIYRFILDEIDFIESDRRKIYIHLNGTEVVGLYYKLGEVMKELPEKFLWCHQSYIVNMDKIYEMSAEGIRLYGKESIPISRLRLKETKDKYVAYIEDNQKLHKGDKI